MPWCEPRPGTKAGFTWRLARFYASAGVVTLDKGNGDAAMHVADTAIPAPESLSKAETAYARFCWRCSVDPLSRIPTSPLEAHSATRKRPWRVYCTEVPLGSLSQPGIRVSGCRFGSRGPTGPNLPSTRFPAELREILEIKDHGYAGSERLGGWLTVAQLIVDLSKFKHPDIRIVRSSITASTVHLVVKCPETTHWVVHPAGRSLKRQIKMDAGIRVQQLTRIKRVRDKH